VKADDSEDVVTVARDRRLYPLFSIDGETRLVRASSCPSEDGDLILTTDCDVLDEDLTGDEVQFLLNDLTDLSFVGSVPSGSTEQLTYFANVALSKRWERWSGALSYRRQQSDSSGVRSSSTVADVVSGVLQWRPAPRWTASFRVAYTRQSLATDAVQAVVVVRPVTLFSGFTGRVFDDVAQSIALRAVTVDQDLYIDTFWVRLDAQHDLTKRVNLFGAVTYWDQKGSVGDRYDYSRFRVDLGVTYNFDPIRL
jgi:hypothetical protein